VVDRQSAAIETANVIRGGPNASCATGFPATRLAARHRPSV